MLLIGGLLRVSKCLEKLLPSVKSTKLYSVLQEIRFEILGSNLLRRKEELLRS